MTSLYALLDTASYYKGRNDGLHDVLRELRALQSSGANRSPDLELLRLRIFALMTTARDEETQEATGGDHARRT